MTVKSSGLWCDLCHRPILSGEYWNIKYLGKMGHCCEKCKEQQEEKDE